jgi:hypothetical protein
MVARVKVVIDCELARDDLETHAILAARRNGLGAGAATR